MDHVMFLLFRAYFITLMTVGMMASLTEFRFGRRKLLGIMAVYSAWVVGSSLALLYFGGELLLLRLFLVTISVPATALTYWAANDTPTQAVFNYMTQILLSVLAASVIRHITSVLGLSALMNILLMGIFYGTAIYLEWRFLRKPFRVLIKAIPAHWGILTLIPCVFCAYLIFVASWPGSYLDNPVQMIYAYAAVVPLVVVYIAVFRSLLGQYRIQMERQNAALLTVQISALREKLHEMEEVEERIRVQRHDLRHQLQTAAELLSRGDRESALNFLDTARKRLDERREIHWCRSPVLDAVFSSYFAQAQGQGVLVEAKISLPEQLPVDEGELAIVIANALENALHANLALPRENRRISCRMIGYPDLMLEIVNPFCTAVRFDEEGFPVSPKEGMAWRPSPSGTSAGSMEPCAIGRQKTSSLCSA
jgi:hypothetical protein